MKVTFTGVPQPNKNEQKKNNYLQNAICLPIPQIVETAIGIPVGVACQDRIIKHANNSEINKYLQKALDETNLKQTGLKIRAYKVEDNVNYLQKVFSLINAETGASFGRNAGYNPILNTILIPYKKLQGAIFHEMGHAMNKNFNPTLKALQYLRPILTYSILAIGTIGICTSSKQPPEDGELSKKDKFKNFMHNNAGKLAFAVSTPILLEEFIATVKGNKLAAKVMPENLVKVVKKTNMYGGLCYLTSAAVGAIGISAGVKLKDYIVARKHEKMDKKALAE